MWMAYANTANGVAGYECVRWPVALSYVLELQLWCEVVDASGGKVMAEVNVCMETIQMRAVYNSSHMKGPFVGLCYLTDGQLPSSIK